MVLLKKIKQKVITKSISKLFPKKISILMLHRIGELDIDGISLNNDFKLSPGYLEDFIIKTKKKGFTFIGMDDVYSLLKKNGRSGKFIAITIDDGYRDILENGLPIFKKYNVPFTIYITTSMIEKEFVYWWYLLEDLILKNEELILNSGARFVCKTGNQKDITFKKIRRIIFNLPQKNIKEELEQLFGRYKLNFSKYRDLSLTWEEIKKLNKESIVTIGNHSHSHFSFNKCIDEDIFEDILKSNCLIEKNVGIIPRHFSYPFGDITSISKKHINLISKMKFKTAVTTEQRSVVSLDRANFYKLPRLLLTEKNGWEILKSMGGK